jgi:hypothetical protein
MTSFVCCHSQARFSRGSFEVSICSSPSRPTSNELGDIVVANLSPPIATTRKLARDGSEGYLACVQQGEGIYSAASRTRPAPRFNPHVRRVLGNISANLTSSIAADGEHVYMASLEPAPYQMPSPC